MLGGQVKVVSYNVLAAGSERVTVPDHLKQGWDKGKGDRGMRVVEELRACDGDIICLQEMNRGKDILNGLHGVRNYRMYSAFKDGKDDPDGCSILWDLDKFTLLDNTAKYLFNPVQVKGKTPWPGLAPQNVCAVVGLETHDGKLLVVANTHLLFNPKQEGYRLLQLASAGKMIKEFKEKLEREHMRKARLIFAGDFNARMFEMETEKPSQVYQMMRMGSIGLPVGGDSKHVLGDARRVGKFLMDLTDVAQVQVEGLVDKSSFYMPCGGFKSGYAMAHGEEPKYTTVVKGISFAGREDESDNPPRDKEERHTTDYVFYKENGLRVVEADLGGWEDSAKGAGIPIGGSDHVMLRVGFNMIDFNE